MIPLRFTYAAPSAVRLDGDRASLDLACDSTRPVRFRARLREGTMVVRLALQVLGGVTWAGEGYDRCPGFDFALDPLVTVHPDRVVFESFGQDAGAYASATLSRDLFEPEGEVVCGTTNVDLSYWLSQGIAELRSSRETWLSIGTAEGTGFERRAELPEGWLRGLLRVQEAMTMPGTRLAVRPIDLLKAIRFLRQSRDNLSPRALRWEFEPGQPPCLVLEPWDHVISCKHSSHGYTERREVRTWGRRRLALLEPLLPYADVVDVYLKGRALPSFYVVKLPGVSFLLGLSGWSRQSWSDGAFELGTRQDGRDRALVEPVIDYLREATRATIDEAAAAVGCDWESARRVMTRLMRRGSVLYDLESRQYRPRELFAAPLDETAVFPPDARRERGLEYVTRKQVTVTSSAAREMKKRKVLPSPDGPIERELVFHDWQVVGGVADQPRVEVVLNDEGKVIFGTCGCLFFKDNILNQGPCEHMVALLEASAASRGAEEPNVAPGA